LFCTTGKSFNDGTREKADQVTVVQQSATRDIESEMLGGLDADKVSPFPALLLLSSVRLEALTLPRSVSTTLAWVNRRTATSH
jgi:hypothetical protein